MLIILLLIILLFFYYFKHYDYISFYFTLFNIYMFFKIRWLNNNKLTGSIPSEIGNLTNLKEL